MTPKELIRIRESLGLTQGQLAEAIGAARQTINRWENDGGRMRPIYERLIRELIKGKSKVA